MENFTVDGINIAYEVHGEGDPVLCIGGTGMAPSVWQTFYMPPLLKAGYQVITFANRGIAPSDGPAAPYSIEQMASDTIGLIEHLNLKRTHLISVSMGAFIAEEVSARRPDLIGKTILIGGAGSSSAYTRARMQAEKAMFQAGDIPEEYDFIDGLSSMLSPEVLRDDDNMVEMWAGILKQATPWTGEGRRGQFEAVWAWLLEKDRSELYRNLTVPCLIVAFEHDLLFSPRVGKKAAETIADCKFMEIPGAAHGGFVIKADICTNAALEFFDRH